ncbi:Nucleoside triphosphate pyrophosphohydrolase MazG [hydrothermal vent metagenome]|uniref:Nucleoside triphosphate pyrophosphohydrolase MazG n=1 Tax=hydrothermal vent metagenome TaxID=652676 RepID=A0A3B0U663_9ZZZZ
MKPSRDFSTLVEIMAALRDPKTGCPWDLEQDFKSISHYTIEEAYEVADAIERGDHEDLCSELGDLLLQPVYHAQMASEQELFDLGDVILAISEKMISRHPHVFGAQTNISSQNAAKQWEKIKASERARRAERGSEIPPSVLDDIANTLPALMRAEKLSRRAANAGFDWPDMDGVLDKCAEEFLEVKQALQSGQQKAVKEEIGDLLFAVVNLARKAKIAPEAALSGANFKFIRRFHHVEERCRQDGIKLEEAGLGRLDEYWNEVRKADKEEGK